MYSGGTRRARVPVLLLLYSARGAAKHTLECLQCMSSWRGIDHIAAARARRNGIERERERKSEGASERGKKKGRPAAPPLFPRRRPCCCPSAILIKEENKRRRRRRRQCGTDGWPADIFTEGII